MLNKNVFKKSLLTLSFLTLGMVVSACSVVPPKAQTIGLASSSEGLSSTRLATLKSSTSAPTALSNTSADRQNNIIRERVANYCKFMADVFYTVAVLRDKKTDPQVVYASMMESDLPDDIKAEAANIVTLVYSVPELNPDEIGFSIFGQCVENMTGIRRNT